MSSEAKRLKQLEEENRRLKEMVADLSLDSKILKNVLFADPAQGKPACRYGQQSIVMGESLITVSPQHDADL